jgi:hypothetical protein
LITSGRVLFAGCVPGEGLKTLGGVEGGGSVSRQRSPSNGSVEGARRVGDKGINADRRVAAAVVV